MANPNLERLLQDEKKHLIKETPMAVLQRKLFDDPFHTILGMVRRGKVFGPKKGLDNFLNELIYSVFGIDKDEATKPNDTGPYTNNKIILEGQTFNTPKAFELIFPKNIYISIKEGIESNILTEAELEEIGSKKLKKKLKKNEIVEVKRDKYLSLMPEVLVHSVFGKHTYAMFNLSHEYHRQTGEKRTGANYYFTHPVRVAMKTKVTCNRYDIAIDKHCKDENYKWLSVTLSFAHDIVEAMKKFREKKRNRMILKREGTVGQIEKLNHKIENPPELHLNSKVYADIKGREPREVFRTMLSLLSNLEVSTLDAKEEGPSKYERYLDTMFKGVQEIYEDENENIRKFYDIVPLIKLNDAIDNTESLIGTDIDSRRKRIDRNHLLAKHTYNFIKRNNITYDMNPLLHDKLSEFIDKSLDYAEHTENKYRRHSKRMEEPKEDGSHEYGPAFKSTESDFKSLKEQLTEIKIEYENTYIAGQFLEIKWSN